jgi:tryptophan-rich sensory protein
MELLIKLGGAYHILLIIFHLLFWRIFNWQHDLISLSFINRQTMQVMNIILIFIFLIFAWISLVHTQELLSTPLGNHLILLICLLWIVRSVLQVVFYKLNHWASFLLLGYFLAGGILYGIPAIYG